MGVVEIDIGCQPSPSGSDEAILSNERRTLVMFAAIDTKKSSRGYLEDKGIAIVECVGCCQSRHGYPNDEGRQEHPLWGAGLKDACGVCEVLESSWVEQVSSQMKTSARRIWGRRYESAYKPTGQATSLRHFIFTFKESTFECIAQGLSVSFHLGSFEDATHALTEMAFK